jgi:dihydroorotate dehydrogenase (NAD+) catalytic subunit
MGGIRSYSDALEFLYAGAVAVAIGTEHFMNPRVVENVADGLYNHLIQRDIPSIHHLVPS